jgi:Tfp pilus assembly protein PilF
MKKLITTVFIGVQALGLAAVVVSQSGCAEAITYAKDARRDGLRLYQEKNYVESAAAFKNATRQDPRDYKSFYYLGCCYDQTKQYPLAITAYRSSLDTMSLTLEGKEDKTFRLNVLQGLALAIARSSGNHLEIASLEQKTAGSANPEDFHLLAKVYRYAGDPDAAIETYNRAMLLATKDSAIAKEYGLYLEQLAQNEKASLVLRRAYQLDPNDKQIADALRRLGVVPGPSIRDPQDSAQPVITRGPIPNWDLTRVKTEPSPVPAP